MSNMDQELYRPNEILEQGSINAEEMKVVYYRPKLIRRVMANFIDIFIFVTSVFLAAPMLDIKLILFLKHHL